MTPSWPESNREKCPSGLVALHSPPGSLRWGRSCEWVVALSASSLCSGVSSRQEVIEFPLLKVSISAQPSNPPEMKWTADVCVCVSGGSMKGENSVSGGEREGGYYKDKNCSWSKMFQGRKKPNHQNWKMWHARKKKKYTNSIYAGPKFVEFIPEAVWKSYQFDWASRRDFVMKALPRSLAVQHSQDGSIWTMVLEKKFADSAICNL